MPQLKRGLAAFLTVTSLLCVYARASHAQQPSIEEGIVRLRTGTVNVLSLPPDRTTIEQRFARRRSLLETGEADAWGSLTGAIQLLVKLRAPVSEEVLLSLAAVARESGGQVGDFVPDSSVVVVAQPSAIQQLRKLPGVIWVGEVAPEWKVSPEWPQIFDLIRQQGPAAVQAFLDSSLDSLDDDQALASQSAARGSSPGNKGLAGLAVEAGSAGGALVAVDAIFPTYISMGGALDANEGDEPNFAALAVRAWQRELDALCNMSCFMRAAAPSFLVVGSPVAQLEAVVGWLARQPLVHWVAAHKRLSLANFYAAAITQSGSFVTVSQYQSSGPNGTTPIWDAGLRGQGQVVGMGDTGLDYDHCLFADPAVPLSSDSFAKDASGVFVWDSTSHRKVRYYRQMVDGVDSNGHGTHCAGSAVSSLPDSAVTSSVDWRGMAPAAKIAFLDVGRGSQGSIQAPEDLMHYYYPYTYNRGARVHSDSWGSDSADYDVLAFYVDYFAYRQQDFVPVFAAGNFGYLQIDSTITSPASSKNCVAVAAGLTGDYEGTIEQESIATDSRVYLARITGGLPGSGVEDATVKLLLAEFGPTLGALVGSTASTGLPLVIPSPPDGCATLARAAQLKGRVLLMQRGNCSYSAKVQRAQRAGAAAVLISNQLDTGFVKLGLDDGYAGPALTVPAASLPKSTARPIWLGLQARMSLRVQFLVAPTPANRFDSLAFFSSIGPTLDGRIKPDIVAQGTTIAAVSDGNPASNNCRYKVDRGTSMATPIVAGALALIRQYFAEGWYPSGAPNAALQYNASGALLKATLLGGAVAMDGSQPSDTPEFDGVPLEPPPSFRQGFGRAHLGRSLPLAGQSAWRMQFVDRVRIRTGESHKYCLQGTPGGPLRITLVWMDAPSSVAAAANLVNDIDLAVYADSLSGFSLLGNGGDPDHLNNVEQVVMDDAGSGLVIITVTGFAIPYPQPYSLVVLGSFSGTLEPVNSTLADGAVNPGWDGVRRADCTLPVTIISSGPNGLQNVPDASFNFSSRDAAPQGYECQLSFSAATNLPITSSAATWQTCTRPAVYTGLADGDYLFQVRAKGYVVKDQRLFTVDTVPPATNLSSAQAPASVSPRTAIFEFEALDANSVTFLCRLRYTSGAWANGSIIDGAGQVGAWEECPSLKRYDSLTPGSWSFEVRGVDAAGNDEAGNGVWPYYNWTVALPSYAKITQLTRSASASSTLTFAFQGIGAGAAQGLECSLVAQDATTGDWAAGTYATCTSPKTYSFLPAGQYRLSVRIKNAATANDAISTFEVDTLGPTVAIIRAPDAMIASTSTVVQFETEAAAVRCRLLPTASEAAPPAFEDCVSPKQYDNMTDNSYLFQVVGSTLSGVDGPIAAASFTVDTTDPTVTDVSFKSGTNTSPQAAEQLLEGSYAVTLTSTSVTVTFTASDGVLASGLNSTICRFTPEETSTTDGASTVGSEQDYFYCNSPAAFSNLDSQRFLFAVYAVDNAGNQGKSYDYHLKLADGVLKSGAGSLGRVGLPVLAAWTLCMALVLMLVV